MRVMGGGEGGAAGPRVGAWYADAFTHQATVYVSLCALPATPLQSALVDPFWMLASLVLLFAGGLVMLSSALGRLRRLEELLARRLEPLGRVESAVSRLAENHGDLDLRRVEHALIDVRDGLRRQEERLASMLDALEEARHGALTAPEGLAPAGADATLAPRGRASALRERIVARLLALGFDRIEVLTPFEEIEAMLEGDGEVRLLARRGGAQHKGRAVVREGTLADVSMRATYEAFP